MSVGAIEAPPLAWFILIGEDERIGNAARIFAGVVRGGYAEWIGQAPMFRVKPVGIAQTECFIVRRIVVPRAW